MGYPGDGCPGLRQGSGGPEKKPDRRHREATRIDSNQRRLVSSDPGPISVTWIPKTMNPGKVVRSRVATLTDLPNVGRETAADLRLLGYERPDDIKGACPFEMHRRLCGITGHVHDPCVIDIFMSVTEFLAGDPPRPWWSFTRRRKDRLSQGAATTADPAE